MRLTCIRSARGTYTHAATTATGWGTVPKMIDQFVPLMVDTLKKDAVI